jgi:predicted component of type VI protein secretion system
VERLAAERRGRPFLLYRDGGGAQVLLELGPRVTIGRGPGCDVALPWDREVSRLHAVLERLGDDWVLADERLSRNGTWVNGERLDARRRLRDGDVIAVGATQIGFVAPLEGGASATAAGTAPVPDISAAQRRVLAVLCAPVQAGGAPASNPAIAAELVLAVDTVKGTLGRLFELFEIGDDVPQNQKRALLARRALACGVLRG